MSVTLRGSVYHYRFIMNGVDYHGACPDCRIRTNSTQREIEAVRKTAEKMRVG